MADKKISQLTDGTSFQAGDEAVVNRSGTNYKVDPTQFGSSIDVTGTVTADGLTVDTDTLYVDAANDRVGIGTTSPAGSFVATGLSIGLGNNLSTSNPVGGAFSFVDPDGETIRTTVRIGDDTYGSGAVTTDLQIISYGSGDDAGGGSIRFINSRISAETGLIKSSRQSLFTGYMDFYTQSGGLKKRMRLADNGDISFYEDTGTTPKFFWDASAEQLGLGTTAPTQPLTIKYSDTSSAPTSSLTESDTGAIRIYNESNSAAYTGIFLSNRLSGSSHALIGLRYNSAFDDGDLFFKVRNGAGSSAEVLTLKASGYVGIGTSSPASKLHLGGFSGSVDGTKGVRLSNNAGTVALFEIGSSNDSFVGTSSSSNFSIRTNNTARLTIVGASGNVGIGTSTAVTPLHVVDPSTSYVLAETTGTGTSAGFVLKGDASANYTLFTTQGVNQFAVFDNAAGSERMRIDSSGNLLLGGTGTPTSSAGNLVLYNGTAPTGNATNGVILYAEDVSASSELKVRDEAGNVTTLSPHNFDLIPEGPSEDMAWSYYSERDGKRINVDMLKAIRVLEQLSGEKLVHIV